MAIISALVEKILNGEDIRQVIKEADNGPEDHQESVLNTIFPGWSTTGWEQGDSGRTLYLQCLLQDVHALRDDQDLPATNPFDPLQYGEPGRILHEKGKTIAGQLKTWMKEHGFINVDVTVTTSWPEQAIKCFDPNPD